MGYVQRDVSTPWSHSLEPLIYEPTSVGLITLAQKFYAVNVTKAKNRTFGLLALWRM